MADYLVDFGYVASFCATIWLLLHILPRAKRRALSYGYELYLVSFDIASI